MKKKTFEDLLDDELRDILDVERQITKALPNMVDAAETAKLKEVLSDHQNETIGQIDRLHKIFSLCHFVVRAKKCEAMKGLIQDGETLIENLKGSPPSDAGIITAAQKIEHYEIATYSALREFALLLGLGEVVDLLQESLNEEVAMNDRLTALATVVNVEALQVS